MKTNGAFLAAWKLEVYKQRRTFRSVWLVLALTFGAIVPAVCKWTEWEAVRITQALFSLLLATGIPLIAGLMAAVPAVSLSREPEAGVEQVLPLHPRYRILAAYLAGVLYMLLTLTLSLLLGALFLRSGAESDVLSDVVAGSASPSWWLLMLQLNALAFALSYWLRLGLAGGALAIVCAGLEVFLPAASSPEILWSGGMSNALAANPELIPTLSVMGPWWAFRLSSMLVPSALLGLAGALCFLHLLAPRLERGMKLGFSRSTAATFALAVGLLLTILLSL